MASWMHFNHWSEISRNQKTLCLLSIKRLTQHITHSDNDGSKYRTAAFKPRSMKFMHSCQNKVCRMQIRRRQKYVGMEHIGILHLQYKPKYDSTHKRIISVKSLPILDQTHTGKPTNEVNQQRPAYVSVPSSGCWA